MKRTIELTLKKWKADAQRRPLLIRGARQIGKSYSVSAFGRTEFSNVVEINFEQHPRLKACFETLEPKTIVETISVLTKSEIIPGKTLLFLDEIQECPEAIRSMRYFYEQMPELHVISAGSLLEFVLASEQFNMPVGRVQYLYMKPMSFLEFLHAIGESRSAEIIESLEWERLPAPAIHQHLLAQVRKYAIIGGMPAVVAAYADGAGLEKCFQIQTSLVQTYRDDFGKYATKVRHKYLEKILYAVPKMVGRKFKYSHVDNSIQSRDLKNAVELLEKAGIIYRIKQTRGEGLPLEANAREQHFKTIFLDIGLMQNLCGLSGDMLISTDDDFIKINEGALAEQFTGQELVAASNCLQAPSLYYWAREARNSSAEVDYLVSCASRVFPLEVKAGKTGTLKSMHLFLGKYQPPVGIRISQHYFNDTAPLISLPFYAISRLPYLLERFYIRNS